MPRGCVQTARNPARSNVYIKLPGGKRRRSGRRQRERLVNHSVGWKSGLLSRNSRCVTRINLGDVVRVRLQRRVATGFPRA